MVLYTALNVYKYIIIFNMLIYNLYYIISISCHIKLLSILLSLDSLLSIALYLLPTRLRRGRTAAEVSGPESSPDSVMAKTYRHWRPFCAQWRRRIWRSEKRQKAFRVGPYLHCWFVRRLSCFGSVVEISRNWFFANIIRVVKPCRGNSLVRILHCHSSLSFPPLLAWRRYDRVYVATAHVPSSLWWSAGAWKCLLKWCRPITPLW